MPDFHSRPKNRAVDVSETQRGQHRPGKAKRFTTGPGPAATHHSPLPLSRRRFPRSVPPLSLPATTNLFHTLETRAGTKKPTRILRPKILQLQDLCLYRSRRSNSASHRSHRSNSASTPIVAQTLPPANVLSKPTPSPRVDLNIEQHKNRPFRPQYLCQDHPLQFAYPQQVHG